MNKVQEALNYSKAGNALRDAFQAYKKTQPENSVSLRSFAAGYNSALSELGKCEPVVIDSVASGIINGKRQALPMGAVYYTSPISKEWVDVPYEERRELYKSVSKGNIDGFADLLSAKLKQLNAEKG